MDFLDAVYMPVRTFDPGWGEPEDGGDVGRHKRHMLPKDEPGNMRRMNREMRRNVETGFVFCDQVRERRKLLGLTQRQLADRVGVSLEQLRDDEKSGTTNIGKVARYAQALGCHPRDLIYPPQRWSVGGMGFD